MASVIGSGVAGRAGTFSGVKWRFQTTNAAASGVAPGVIRRKTGRSVGRRAGRGGKRAFPVADHHFSALVAAPLRTPATVI
jgi:hypothetical protein